MGPITADASSASALDFVGRLESQAKSDDDLPSYMNAIFPSFDKETYISSLLSFITDLPHSELHERFYFQLYRCFHAGILENHQLLRMVAQELFGGLICRYLAQTVQKRRCLDQVVFGREGCSLDVLILLLYRLIVSEDENRTLKWGQELSTMNLNRASVYHDPQEFSGFIIDEEYGGARKGKGSHGMTVNGHIEYLTKSNKWTVLRVLMRELKQDLVDCTSSCHESVISLATWLLEHSNCLGVIGAPLPPQVEEPKVSVSSEPDSFSDEQSTDSISPRFALLNKLDWMYQQDVDGDTSKSQRFSQRSLLPLDVDFLLELLDHLFLIINISDNTNANLRQSAVDLVKLILAEGEFRAQCSIVFLATAILRHTESLNRDVHTSRKGYLVPPIGVWNPEVRSGLTTAWTIRQLWLLPTPTVGVPPTETQSVVDEETVVSVEGENGTAVALKDEAALVEAVVEGAENGGVVTQEDLKDLSEEAAKDGCEPADHGVKRFER